MKRINKISNLLFIFIGILIFDTGLSFLHAQKYIPKITKIVDEKGQTPSATFAIVEDHIGFIWFGTVDGLYRYDGYNFKIFRHQNNNWNSLSNNTIRSLCLGKGGKLWIGTQGGGVDCFDIQTEKFTNYSSKGISANEISGNSVWSVFEDKDGNIWMGVSDKGLDMLDTKTGKFSHFDILNGKTSNLYEIRSITQDKNGLIWIGNGSFGLFSLDPKSGKMMNYQHNPDDNRSLSSNGVFDIHQDKSGKLWICTYGGGLNLFDYKTGTFTLIQNDPHSFNSLVSNLTYRITENTSGGHWVSTEYGLSFMSSDLKNFTNFTHSDCEINSITENRIRTCYVDNQGILWIGTETGVDKLVEQRRFKLFTNSPSNPNSLEDGIVRSILEDNEGNLWIGLIDKGLVYYDRKSGDFNTFKNDRKNLKSISGNHITALYQDSKNDIWIGEWDSGLHKYNKATGGFDKIASTFAGKYKLSDNRIQLIKEGSPGILWIGTEGGINRFDTRTGKINTFVHEPDNPNSLSSNGVQSNAFVVDPEGNLWIGMWSGGINKIEFKDSGQEKAIFKNWKNDLKNKNSLSNNNVISLHLSKSGILWIGTFGGGLNRYDIKKDEFKHYSPEDGLPNNIIFSILEDEKENLWLSTDKGISLFNPTKETFQNFDHTDGLQDDHFFWGSSFKSKSGEMFFGGINGFNSFYPDSVKINKIPANPVILSIKVFDYPIGFNYSKSGRKEIELAYDENFLTIEFSGLDFIEPQKGLFKFKLEGVEKNWNIAENRRFASYTDLSPGTYIFHLNVSNNDEIWNTEELTLKIIIRPPWWKTLWARILFIILVVGSIYFFYNIRVGILTRQKHRLEEQVSRRTNEISEKNASLKQKNEEILNQKEEMRIQAVRLNEKNLLLEKTLNELEMTQKALIESEKMASLGVLSAGVAHEINNPLNFITLSIENLKSEIGEIVQSKAEIGDERKTGLMKLLDHAETGAMRISKIVNSLRLYSHSNQSEMQVCDVKDLINRTLTIIHSIVPNHILVKVNFCEMPFVKCKQDQIGQVIINIIDNAVHAIEEKTMKQNEKIEINTENQKYLDKNYVSINISNTGPYLSDEMLVHLFDPFYTTKAPNKGSGLGLYIAYNIIKEHEGFLFAENTDNVVLFRILIPV